MDGAVPRLGADVPRWYGETIGFWDKDVLITWTSNIQGWSAHGAFEFSSKMQSIEIYTPLRDAAGKVTALNHEAVLYDPEALVEPIRLVRNFTRLSGFEQGDPYTYIRCVPTIYPVKGHSTPVSPGRRDRVRSARHVRPALGADVGEVFRGGYGTAQGRRHLHFSVGRSREQYIHDKSENAATGSSRWRCCCSDSAPPLKAPRSSWWIPASGASVAVRRSRSRCRSSVSPRSFPAGS